MRIICYQTLSSMCIVIASKNFLSTSFFKDDKLFAETAKITTLENLYTYSMSLDEMAKVKDTFIAVTRMWQAFSTTIWNITIWIWQEVLFLFQFRNILQMFSIISWILPTLNQLDCCSNSLLFSFPSQKGFFSVSLSITAIGYIHL